jgi:hypothetical protein
MSIYRFVRGAIVLMAIFSGPFISVAAAQDTLGGHIGFVLPLVTRANGTTTSISDDFVIGFPTGVTVRKSPTFAFDLELVPVIQNDPLHIDLTVHPGAVWGVGNGWGAGARLAFDVNHASWGFTPILNHGLLKVGTGSTLFGEIVVPIRFQDNGSGMFTSIGLGVHIGVGF